MNTFIQLEAGVDCRAPANEVKLPIYTDEAAIVTAIQAGCLPEGSIIGTPSAADAVPQEGDACRTYLRTEQSGIIAAFGTTPNTFNNAYLTPVIWNCSTQELTAPAFKSCSVTLVGDGNSGTYTFGNGDIKYNGVSIIPDLNNYPTITCASTIATDAFDTCISGYATETYADNAACNYFESCFADCFSCCIAEWFECHRGDINTSNPGRDNSLWVV